MKIFLAARYQRYPEMMEKAKELQAMGVEVTSRWIYGNHQWPPDVPYNSAMAGEVRARFALEDMHDLSISDAIIFFADPDPLPEGEIPSAGGKHTELGMALAMGVGIVIIGRQENVYHALPGIVKFDTWEDFLVNRESATK